MEKLLLVGDSHCAILSSPEKKGYLEIYVFDMSDDVHNLTLSKLVNGYSSEFVLFSIGEIDVRFHLSKLEKFDVESLVRNYEEFLSKIQNKKIIVCSIPPPATEKYLEKRKEITQYINKLLFDMCEENSYKYFDPYSYFTIDGYLDISKSDGSVHIHPSYKGKILEEIVAFIKKL